MRIGIFYDSNICDAKTLAQHYLDSTFLSLLERPRFSKDGALIRIEDGTAIDFIRIDPNSGTRGRLYDMAFIPEHYKGSQIVSVIIAPRVKTKFLGFYNQAESFGSL